MKIDEYKQMMSFLLNPKHIHHGTKIVQGVPYVANKYANGGRVNLSYGGYIRQMGNKHYLRIGTPGSPFYYNQSFATKEEAENAKKIELDKIKKIIDKEKEGYLTGPELVEHIKDKRNINLAESSIAQRAKNVGLDFKPFIYGSGKSKLYKEPTEEQLDTFKNNKLKQYASPEAQKYVNERTEFAKELSDLSKKGMSIDDAANILKNKFPELKSGISTIRNARDIIQKEGGNVLSKREGLSSTASTKVINNLNALNQDEQLKNILSNPDFSLSKDLSKATDRIKQILPNSTDQTAERQLGQLLYEYSGQGRYDIETGNQNLINNAEKIKEGYFAEKGFGQPSSSLQRIATEARVGEQIGEGRTFFPNMRKKAGRYTPEGYSMDEIKNLKSSDINKTGYYSLFSQGINSDININKGRTIDKTLGNAEQELQKLNPNDPNYNELREDIKNKYNEQVEKFTSKVNKDLKKSEKPIRALELSFDHPEISVANYDKLSEKYPKLTKGLNDIYDKYGYSFIVPKDVRSIDENLEYLKSAKGQAEVKRLSGLNANRLYSQILPVFSTLSEDLEKGKLLPTTLKGLGMVGTAAGTYGAAKEYDEGKPILDVASHGWFGVPSPIEELARYKNLTDDEKLSQQRLNHLNILQLQPTIGIPRKDLIETFSKQDPDFKGKPIDYLSFLKLREKDSQQTVQDAEERFQKEVWQPLLQQKQSQRVPILDMPVLQKIKENYQQMFPEEKEQKSTDYNYSNYLKDGGHITRTNYAGGGEASLAFEFLKKLRNISDSIRELKNNTHMLGYTARSEGVTKAAEEALTPYAGGFKGNKHETLIKTIQNAKEHLPKEYHGVLDDMKSHADKHAYDYVDDMAKALDKTIDPNLKFENLPKNMFPMEDPLNDSFIIIDPEKGYSTSRYTFSTTVDPKTGRGTREIFDTFDPTTRNFLKREDWKPVGIESLEKGKEGLN